MTALDLQSEWAGLLVDMLAASGVRDVVISPGSRSTPFVLAAARHPGLRRWDVIDERSAAFFALGQARATGAPSLAICTSGTAGAHYLPAVIEASLSFVPLLVLTADRPLDLQQCGAPQTVDQVKLFGDHVRAFFDLGLPDASLAALRGLRRAAAQAVHATRWPTPGPVHLEARARKPLEPRPAAEEGERRAAQLARELAKAPPRAHAPALVPSGAALDRLAARLHAAQRPLVVAGPGPLRQAEARSAVAELLGRSGAVLLREAASQLRARSVTGVDAFDVLVETAPIRSGAAPDLVLQLGAAPTSAALHGWLAACPEAERWVAAPHGWHDPDGTAHELVVGEIADVAAGLAARLRPSPPGPTAWQALWQGGEEVAQRVIDGALRDGPSEGAAVRAVAECLPPGGTLFVGNSLAIRELDLFCPARIAECPVLCQRGASGIDGLVSGAAGAATVGGPVTLLLGDVSFLHDVGGLWAARHAGVALTVVVLHNGGGRIFDDLPLGATGIEGAMHHFTTPHDLGFAHAAGLYGLAHRAAGTVAQLREALASTDERPRLIEATVPPTGLAALRGRIVRAVAAELEGAA